MHAAQYSTKAGLFFFLHDKKKKEDTCKKIKLASRAAVNGP